MFDLQWIWLEVASLPGARGSFAVLSGARERQPSWMWVEGRVRGEGGRPLAPLKLGGLPDFRFANFARVACRKAWRRFS
jgi:hypothetical protein